MNTCKEKAILHSNIFHYIKVNFVSYFFFKSSEEYSAENNRINVENGYAKRNYQYKNELLEISNLNFRI